MPQMPAPTQPQQGQQQAPVGLNDEQKQKVENVASMGFEKEQVEQALLAAWWDEARAIDYLVNVIFLNFFTFSQNLAKKPKYQ